MAILTYADRVKETTTTTGTGTLTLGGAVTGFRTFTSALSTGAVVTYEIDDGGSNWEVGEGTFTTAGTTLSRTRVLASSNSNALVSFAAGTKTVSLSLVSRDIVDTQGVVDGQRGLTGAIAATYDRASTGATVTGTAATSGTMRLTAIFLPKALSVTSIAPFLGSTGVGTPTHQWFCLCDSARVVLAVTSDDTTTAWAATTKKSLNIASGPFITTYTGLYYIGVLVTATTMPTYESAVTVLATGARNTAPLIAGNSTTGLTTPSSLGTTLTAITSVAIMPYIELL